MIEKINGISSPIEPYLNYTYSIELLSDKADLWWSIDNSTNEITFELHINTIGWIALGISPSNIFLLMISTLFSLKYLAGGMIGADIGVGWVNGTGHLFFQV